MRAQLKIVAVWLVGLICLGGCQTTTPAPPAHDAALAAKLDPILQASGADVGVRIVDLGSGRELYARQADRRMMPASNMKLVTTATALDLFGPDYHFQTRLGISGGDLYLIGGGDPGLGDPTIGGWYKHKPTDDFEGFAQALTARGMTRIKGKLYYDDWALDAQWIHPSWSKSFREFWYAAPVSGLNFNDNCIDVTVHPAGAAGEPARFEVVPPTAGIRIVDQCVIGSAQTAGIRRADDPFTYILSGTCSKTATLASKPVENPGFFTADALKTYLASRGIAIEGKIERTAGPIGVNVPVIASHETSMRDAIKRVNKSSQNFMAEAFSKQSGELLRQRGQSGSTSTSWEAGEMAARAFLSRNHIDAAPLRMVDGSGLSRDNRVTARMLSDLLAVMDRHPYRSVFVDSLPIGGVDGTLKKRFEDMQGRVVAKTGSIGGVRSLSGYTTLADGRRVAFSILCNEIPGDEEAFVKGTIDGAVRAMVQ
jgi:D-alanyl-D-alanine carboxypeptidase/D-alanyl-D-alanine-endopeptidase (penicillin-binding protein 4)